MIFLLIFFLNQNIRENLKSKGYLNLWINSKSLSRITSLFENQGFRLRAISRWENYISGYFPNYLTKSKKLLNLIKDHKIVLKGKKFTEIKPMSFSPSDYGDSYETLSFLKIPEVHKKGFIGQNVTISLFDTGFDLNHPALLHIREGKRVKFSYDFNSGDSLFLLYNSQRYRIPHIRAIGYIGKTTLTGNPDTVYIFYNFLNERDNIKNKWKIYGCLFTKGFFIPSNEPKLLSPDTINLLPSSLFLNGKIYLASKLSFQNYDAIYIKFLNKLLNIDSTKILLQNPFIYDLEIFNLKNKINVIYTDSYSINITDLNGNIIFSRNKEILNFSINKINDILLVLYETGLENPLTGIIFLDTLYNVIKDTLISRGHSAFLFIKNDTLKIILVSGNTQDTLYELKFDRNVNLIERKIIDTGFFIKSPIYHQNKIYYSKNGIIYFYSQGAIDSTFEYFVDDINSYENFLVYRRRGDKNVNIDPLTDFTDPLSGIYHGTRMLGIIGGFAPGKLIGTAPGADFLLFKTERTNTLEGGNFENIIEEDFWVEALELSKRFGAKIVSSSLGYIDWYSKKDMDGKTAISSRAASKALSKGILVFTAAGNVSHSDTTKADTTIVAPGDADSVITVGGIKMDGKIWRGSAYGPSADGRIKPDIVAPFKSIAPFLEITSQGDSIYSYSESQGTSVSTALMSGFAASILSAHPDWSAKKLYEVIIKTSSKYLNPDNIYGYGVPNALSALNFEKIKVPSKEGEKSRIISLYPNPVKGKEIKIEYIVNEALTPLSIKIFTPSGKKVFEKSYFTLPLGRYKEKIDLINEKGKKLKPGFYILVLETSESKDYMKLIIEE
ncbi:MAG: S8 family serine peptidase [candidate division WOR-3 bacterium]